MKRWVWLSIAVAIVGSAVFFWRLTGEIVRQSSIDEAHNAEVIVVFGAAEYRGRPSPVLRARLDHALDLYRRHFAPLIITTGGAGGDPIYTESEVGRTYLSKNGVPVESIVIESEGESTAQSSIAVAEIMQRMGLRSCIVVSDGYHIYRAKKMLQERGLIVYGSPRPAKPSGEWQKRWLCFRQAIGWGLWTVGIRI